MRSLLALALATGLASPFAHADFAGLLAPKDWQFEESATPVPTCRAYTIVSNSENPLELSLSYPKDGKSLPTILVKTNRAAALASVKISSRESEPLFLLSAASESEPATYYYAPVNFPRLEKLIRDAVTLDLFFDPKGSPEAVRVSLRGSGEALRSVAKCLGKTQLPKEFFAALNKEKEALTPDLGDRSVARLKEATETAYQAYLSGLDAKAALDELRKPAASLLRKEKAALEVFNAADAKRARADTKLAEGRNEVSTLQTKIATAKASLASLLEQKPGAEQDLAQKKAIYEPLKAQLKAYEQVVEQARKSVASLESEIKKDEALISKNERTIRALQSEQAQLQRVIPGLESEASRLRIEYSQAESNYNSYNPSWERQRYLDNESRYRWAKSDLSSKESELSRARSDYYSASSRADMARSALYSCQAQPNNPNCSSQESDLRRYESERDDAQRKQRSLESDISSLESDIRRYESDADSRVSSEQSRLRSIRDSYASALYSKESELSRARGRVSEIRNTVPGLRRQIDKAEGEIPVLRQKLAAANVTLQQAIDTRDAFSSQIGFEKALQEYEAAQATLKAINEGIAQNKKDIPVLEKSHLRAQRNLPSLEKELVRAEAGAADTRTKLAAIQEQLKPLREQEAVVLAELAQHEARFKEGQAVYQDLYAELLGR